MTTSAGSASNVSTHESDTGSSVPLWLDVDTGHDDAFALLLATHLKPARLIGVSTVHGNSSVINTTNNSLAVLEALGRQDVPVYAGSSKPLRRSAVYAENFHGDTGLDGTTLLPKPSQEADKAANFVEAMYEALRKTPTRSAWLVATGALTNVARLFERHPELAHHIKGLAIMGGAIGHGFSSADLGSWKDEGKRICGNWTTYAEFNIYIDPEAAQAVFSHGALAAKTTLIPLDLTHQALATRLVRHRLLYGYQEEATRAKVLEALANQEVGYQARPLRLLFNEILSFFAASYAKNALIKEGPPLHDPLAVAAALTPEIFVDHQERFSVGVVTEGEHDKAAGRAGQLGRTVVQLLEPGTEGVRIPRTLDLDRFWNSISEALSTAEQTSPLERPEIAQSISTRLLYRGAKDSVSGYNADAAMGFLDSLADPT